MDGVLHSWLHKIGRSWYNDLMTKSRLEAHNVIELRSTGAFITEKSLANASMAK